MAWTDPIVENVYESKPQSLEVNRAQSLETGLYQGTDLGQTAQELCFTEDSQKHSVFNRAGIK